MDVKALPERQGKLEADLAAAINSVVEQFREETALSVAEIDVSMFEATTIDDASKQYRVGGCSVRLGGFL